MNNNGVYTLIWIHEEEEWYYFKNDFDKDQFVDGYCDYYVTVENDIIMDDTYHADNKGLKFSEEYEMCVWQESPIAIRTVS